MRGIERRTMRSRTGLPNKRTRASASNQRLLANLERFVAKAQRRRAMHQCVDEILRPRPRAEPSCGVDVPSVAQIDERTAEALREFASAGERHPRIGFTADQNGRNADTPGLERSRESEFLRACGRNE